MTQEQAAKLISEVHAIGFHLGGILFILTLVTTICMVLKMTERK